MFPKAITMLLFLCLLLLRSVCAISDTSPSGGEIKIIGPPGLKDHYKSTNGKISALPALFGIPVYNGQFVGTLKAFKEHMDVCETLPENYFQSDPLDEHTKKIALVERGTCSFVEKVKNCQIAGAKGAVVYDNVDFGNLPIMADDGTGESVSIPSVIISYNDGLILKSHVDDDSAQGVVIEISWGLPRPDGRVEWEFWTHSEMSSVEKMFVVDLKDAVQSLGDKILFTPHYFINDGLMEASDNDCNNDRKYCSFSVNGVPGKQLLKESLNQLCMWKFGQSINDTLLWWDYMEMFNEQCSGNKYKWDGICSSSILHNLAVNETRSDVVEAVRKCVFESGGLNNQSNTLFDGEIESFTKYEVLWIPAVTINNEMYNGNMLCSYPVDIATCSIFAAICAAFAPETIPQPCLEHREIGCPRGENRDACGVCGGDGSSCKISQAKTMAVGFIFIIILIVAIAIGIGFYFKRRFIRTEEQFVALRNMYEPLRESELVGDKTIEREHLNAEA